MDISRAPPSSPCTPPPPPFSTSPAAAASEGRDTPAPPDSPPPPLPPCTPPRRASQDTTAPASSPSSLSTPPPRRRQIAHIPAKPIPLPLRVLPSPLLGFPQRFVSRPGAGTPHFFLPSIFSVCVEEGPPCLSSTRGEGGLTLRGGGGASEAPGAGEQAPVQGAADGDRRAGRLRPSLRGRRRLSGVRRRRRARAHAPRIIRCARRPDVRHRRHSSHQHPPAPCRDGAALGLRDREHPLRLALGHEHL